MLGLHTLLLVKIKHAVLLHFTPKNHTDPAQNHDYTYAG